MSELRHPRRAYVCVDPKTKEIHERKFLVPGEKVPMCPVHGLLRPQANTPYRGVVPPTQATKPMEGAV